MSILKDISEKIFRKMPLGNIIIFESVPNMSDNTKAVFDEMITRGINEKYTCVWLLYENNIGIKPIKNVKYILYEGIWNKLRYTYYKERARCIIECNRFITSDREDQLSFYIAHGTSIKRTRDYYVLPDNIDYLLIASEQSKDVMSYELNFDKEKIVALGYPRNDVMGRVSKDLHKCFSNEFEKVIVWYPTYRQHKNEKNPTIKNALPVLHNVEMAVHLNEVAKENNVILVVKPHFAQDVSYIKNYNLSNIIFIDDSFFDKNDITSYEFVSSCDALVTDYSSIYYDYLLCDKPIAVVWEDIEDYRKDPGFGVDVDQMMKCANKIYNLGEFSQFIVDVANNNDVYKELRKEINEWANYSDDGKNASRVTDFIIEKADLL